MSTCRSRSRRAATAVLLTALGLTAGCSAGDPTDEVPGLQRRLDAVDAAIAEGDDTAARDALAALVATTTRAEDDGRLDADQADAILAAAARLDSLLPTAGPASDEPTTAAPTTTAPTTSAPTTTVPTTTTDPAPSDGGHHHSSSGTGDGSGGTGDGSGGTGAAGPGPGSGHGKAKGHGAKPGRGNGHR